jgi:6-phosphofructokinase
MAPTNSLLTASVYLRSHASIAGKHVNVGMMTSGGLAPCLSSSIAQLTKYWIEALKEGKISGLTLRMYVDGYAGILTGNSFVVPESEWTNLEKLNFLGGSPIGNSRVKVSIQHIFVRFWNTQRAIATLDSSSLTQNSIDIAFSSNSQK